MKIIISETKRTDLDSILLLWNCPQVMHFVGYPEGLGITMPELEHWFEKMQTATHCKHYSIYCDGVYCGETFYRLQPDLSCDVDIKLMPEARGKGIAATALSFVCAKVFIEKRVCFVKVDPNPANTVAIRLYKRLGFKKVDQSQDWHLTLKSFKPVGLEQFVTIKTVPLADFNRLWSISEKDDWYPYCETNAPYFEEYQPSSYEAFFERKKNQSIRGIYVFDLLVGVLTAYWEDKRTHWLEIGLVIYDETLWGKGLGTYALKWMAHYLFNEFDAIERVGFVTWSGNPGMMRSGEKAYFKKEAVLRKVRYYRGTYYDSVCYGLTRDEWQAFSLAAKGCRKVTAKQEKRALCDRLLRLNPHHFGIETAIQSYANGVGQTMVFMNEAGFISLAASSPTTLEIYVMALHPKMHRQGYGAMLINRAVMYGREKGYRCLLVKTLADSHPDVYYQKTRAFYEALGFEPSQRLVGLWGEENPCQEYVLEIG